jgi:tRNA(Ile)-lysidine synthase TilS/MesJ
MNLQQLMSYTRKAIDRYNMIEDGDKIAIGVSGGKDSLALLYALKGLQRFYPKKFELVAITVSLGFENFDLSKISALCKELDIPYTIINTDIGNIVFNERKEKNPCSLCAKMRKGALNEAAVELGCNKVALGHHKEDIVETMMLALFYEGRFYSFAPVTYLDRSNLYAIRPLMYVPEKEVKSFKKNHQLPVVTSPCPANGYTKREYMKNLLKTLNKENPNLTDRMFRAIEDSDIKGWKQDL